MDHICLYICLLVDIWVFFYLLAVVNITSLNMCVQVFVWTPVSISFGHVPRSGFAWSCGNSVFNFSKNCIQLCLTSWRTFPSITREKRVLARSPVFARIWILSGWLLGPCLQPPSVLHLGVWAPCNTSCSGHCPGENWGGRRVEGTQAPVTLRDCCVIPGQSLSVHVASWPLNFGDSAVAGSLDQAITWLVDRLFDLGTQSLSLCLSGLTESTWQNNNNSLGINLN